MEQNFTQSSSRRKSNYQDQLTEDLGVDVTAALAKEKQRKTRKNDRQLKIEKSKSYKLIKFTTKWMDRYFLDGIIGFIPIVGDAITILFSLPFLYVSLFRIKSIPLSMAILFNILADVTLGLIPFFVGDIADLFYRSYKKNFRLVTGFVEDDRAIIKKVNKQAVFLAIAVLVLSVVIYYLIVFIFSFFASTYEWIWSFFN
ncbi:DUF4112 domain-containing protein [Nonlabens antarcticus]|uniref:DUF4112 domain-containing protein n=1 Tax=Nonlabens antarcticus TaxID=392714 RepID=UPI0018915DC0|nr:DUF4112 domain-containing protein [Nonlabens antarcticus]